MLRKIVSLLIIACLAVQVQAVVSILEPNSRTIWYKNGTVTLNWTSSDPTTDTFLFRVNLRNADQNVLGGDLALADSVNATATTVTIKLPGVNAAQAYTVLFVNTTSPNTVLATSEQFEIAEGSLTSPSSSASASGSATASDRSIPNAQSSSSAAAFPTAAPSGAAGRISTEGYGMLVPGLAAGLTLLGGVIALL